MEWTEDKIIEYINQGWTLSWDRTNQKYKLQKRIDGKVKSYTLPKEFNEFCRRLKENKNLEIFKDIEDGYSIDEIHEKYGLGYKEVKRTFKEYVEWKISRNELADLLADILYELRSYDLWKIQDLEDRLDRASWLIRHALGNAGIKIRCPICESWSYLELRDVKIGNEVTKRWVCSKCGKIPF